MIFNSGVIPISQHPEHRNHPHKVELIMMLLNELLFSFREVGGRYQASTTLAGRRAGVSVVSPDSRLLVEAFFWVADLQP